MYGTATARQQQNDKIYHHGGGGICHNRGRLSSPKQYLAAQYDISFKSLFDMWVCCVAFQPSNEFFFFMGEKKTKLGSFIATYCVYGSFYVWFVRTLRAYICP